MTHLETDSNIQTQTPWSAPPPTSNNLESTSSSGPAGNPSIRNFTTFERGVDVSILISVVGLFVISLITASTIDFATLIEALALSVLYGVGAGLVFGIVASAIATLVNIKLAAPAIGIATSFAMFLLFLFVVTQSITVNMILGSFMFSGIAGGLWGVGFILRATAQKRRDRIKPDSKAVTSALASGSIAGLFFAFVWSLPLVVFAEITLSVYITMAIIGATISAITVATTYILKSDRYYTIANIVIAVSAVVLYSLSGNDPSNLSGAVLDNFLPAILVGFVYAVVVSSYLSGRLYKELLMFLDREFPTAPLAVANPSNTSTLSNIAPPISAPDEISPE